MQRARFKVTDLNPHLSCILCGGYFIDATTITECVHSFCRACIVRYLETSKYCPVCEVQVHKSKPLHCIRSDKTLQDIVYKLVPGLFHNEMKRRRELYASQPPEALKESRDAEDRGECLDEKFIYSPDETFSLSVEYGTENDSQDITESDDTLPKKRFLRCKAALTVSHIKKFIRMKYGIPSQYVVDLQYDKESLLDHYTLIDVAYIYLWKRKGPMKFHYRILERPLKNIKLDYSALKTESPPEKVETSEPEVKTEGKPNAGPKEEEQPTPSCEPPTPVTPVPAEEKCTTPKSDPPPTDVKPEETKVKEDPVKIVVEEAPEDNVEVSSPKKDVSPLKFLPSPPVSKVETKPAVMTVAPLTKPSTSLATSTSGTVTHGLYTGITIKKSPPNTFRISSHLLAPQVPTGPKVPPLKLLKQDPYLFPSKETSHRKSSIDKKKSKSRDRLESKVAQLKSNCSIKSVAPLVISVPNLECSSKKKNESRHENHPAEKSPAEKPPVPVVPEQQKQSEPKVPQVQEEEKMDLDIDLFEGRLIIAEPDPLPKEEDEKKKLEPPPEDPEDEEIDVEEIDSGRGSDISSRAEGPSLSGDDDLGSPDSLPKTPDALPVPTPTTNGTPEPKVCNGATSTPQCDVLDLSTCSRKRNHSGDVIRPKPVANPAVLDKTRQTLCRTPGPPSFKGLLPSLMHHKSHGNNSFKCRGNNLTVINPRPPKGNVPKIVIKNLGPRPDRSHERFHHHHHHHQRM